MADNYDAGYYDAYAQLNAGAGNQAAVAAAQGDADAAARNAAEWRREAERWREEAKKWNDKYKATMKGIGVLTRVIGDQLVTKRLMTNNDWDLLANKAIKTATQTVDQELVARGWRITS